MFQYNHFLRLTALVLVGIVGFSGRAASRDSMYPAVPSTAGSSSRQEQSHTLSANRGAESSMRLRQTTARLRELLDLGSRDALQMAYRGRPRDDWQRVVAELPSEAWNWPVHAGKFVRGFGSGTGRYHLAVDISAPTGTPIRAIQSGLVVFAGNGPSGYGRIVMVLHLEGFLSFYAHCDEVLVTAGELVTTQTAIAKVGSTGRSRGPHLHLELLREGKLCDPLPFIRDGVTRTRCARRRAHPGHA